MAFDAEAYLAGEKRQTENHEFVMGEVFAMVGVGREHVVVSGNLCVALKQRLRGGLFQAYAVPGTVCLILWTWTKASDRYRKPKGKGTRFN